MLSEHAGGWRTLSTRNAFLIHLALSLLIFMTLVAVMVTLWFPGELFFLDGGWEGLKLVALVDLVLGPALTLCLYKPAKKGLLMDMSFIAAFQVAALAYGFVTTFEQRTAAVVFAESRFNTLSNVALIEANENLAERKIKTQSVTAIDSRKPAILVTPEGESAQQFQDLLNGFPQLHERSDKFIIAKDNSDYLRDLAVSEAALEAEDKKGLVKKALAKQSKSADIDVHRFTARYGSGFALFDHNSGRIVDYIEITAETKSPKASATDVAESVE
ncbi:MAG: hypothetical protein V3U65_18685 [Granulosicoccaceae bacterium]